MNRPIGLVDQPLVHETKQRLLEAGLRLMLERGYNALGIQGLLDETGVPKGSFYHHFPSKEAFALQVVDMYQGNVHVLMASTLGNRRRPPIDRVRDFFAGVRESYRNEGYLGCFLGALGQELSGTSELFRARIERCLEEIATRIAACLEEARQEGSLPPDIDTTEMADFIVDAWEGAALRTRLVRTGRPLETVLDFYLGSLTTPTMPATPTTH